LANLKAKLSKGDAKSRCGTSRESGGRSRSRRLLNPLARLTFRTRVEQCSGLSPAFLAGSLIRSASNSGGGKKGSPLIMVNYRAGNGAAGTSREITGRSGSHGALAGYLMARNGLC
jgi:hypothetical protein